MTFDKLFLILVAAALTGCGGGTSSSSKGIEIDLDSDSVAAEDVGEPVSITEKDYHVLTPFTYITNLSSVNISLRQGDYSISARGDSATLSHLQLHFDSNLLTVNIASDNNSDYNYFGTTTNVWLTISAPKIECFSSCANGSFCTSGKIVAENLEVGVLGSGKVLLDTLECKELKIHSSEVGPIHFDHVRANTMTILSKADADIRGDVEVGALNIVNQGTQHIFITGKAESVYVQNKDDHNVLLNLDE